MILLIDFGIDESVSEPLAIASLHAYLTNMKVSCIMYYQPYEKLSIEQMLHRYSPEMVGISMTFASNYKKCMDTVQLIKKFDEKIRIVLGGHDVTISPEKYFFSGVTGLIIGHGEKPLLELSLAIKNGITDFSSIKGFVRERNELANCVCNPIEDLNTLPFLSRHYLAYILSISPHHYVQILSSRGCVGNCSFCSVRQYMKRSNSKYLNRDIRNVVDELEMLHDNYNVSKFVFEDDNFFTYKNCEEKAIDFYHELKKRNLLKCELSMQMRPDMINHNIIHILKKCGVKRLSMGIESFNNQDLLVYNKAISSTVLHEKIALLFEHGYSFDLDAEYRIYAGYITFNPYSTKELLRASCYWMKKYGMTPKKLIRKLVPYPGTPIYEKLQREGLVSSTGDIKFRTAEIENIYLVVTDAITHISRIRDIYRDVVKANKWAGQEKTWKTLSCTVRCLDELMFEAFEDALNTNGASSLFELYREKVNEIVSCDQHEQYMDDEYSHKLMSYM